MHSSRLEQKMLQMIRRYHMTEPGDTVTVAVSGGADSTALLYALYLLREKLRITLKAVHVNHQLRGEESDRDEIFIRDLCQRFEIGFTVCRCDVKPGKKGLEAAAREKRYDCFAEIPGKVATAHTADDNAETVLMRLTRGTGLKGLGGIAPVRGKIIRPLLDVTRQEVLDFLRENFLPHVEDSSNSADDFFRNRLRHHVMPLLKAENPQLALNLSAMALRLREDEAVLESLTPAGDTLSVAALRTLHPALRYRALERILKRHGVAEPEADHIAMLERVVFSKRASARADLPGGISFGRSYDVLERLPTEKELEEMPLSCPGRLELPRLGLTVACEPCGEEILTTDAFTVMPEGNVVLRSRRSGDEIRLFGGTKSLKKIFIDRKIPAHRRDMIPVIADDRGILGVWGIGANLDRVGPGVQIRFEKREENTGGFQK